MTYRVIVSGRVSIDTCIEAEDLQQAILAAQTEALNGGGEVEWEPAQAEMAIGKRRRPEASSLDVSTHSSPLSRIYNPAPRRRML